jgi:hypothetical protein
VEADNLAAAVDWYLAHDCAPLPHLFRTLWMCWGLRDRLGEARTWIDQNHSTRNVTLCLTAFAQLAFVAGHGDRAALLAGAAEGLRERVGLRAWPPQREGEAQTIGQIRQALGANRFDRGSPPAAGSTAARQWPPSARGTEPRGVSSTTAPPARSMRRWP